MAQRYDELGEEEFLTFAFVALVPHVTRELTAGVLLAVVMLLRLTPALVRVDNALICSLIAPTASSSSVLRSIARKKSKSSTRRLCKRSSTWRNKSSRCSRRPGDSETCCRNTASPLPTRTRCHHSDAETGHFRPHAWRLI